MEHHRPFIIVSPTLLLALSALISRLLGVIRDHVLAGMFGATSGVGIYDLDTYYAAFRIPDLLYNLLIFGTISAAFVPIFTQYKKEGHLKSAWHFASSMLYLLLLMIGIIALLAFIFAPYLVPLVAGGFAGEKLILTTRLMRIMLVSPILFGASAVLISIQDSFKSFFYRSLAPIFYNLGIIGGVLFLAKDFGVYGVTAGVLAGAAGQLFIQIPAMWQVGFKHHFMLGYDRQDVRRAFALMGPRVLGLGLSQLTLLINTLMASFLITGSITIFYLADNLQSLPLGVIGISFAITSFATLAELATEKTQTAFAKELRRVIHQILFWVLPATVGMIVLRHEIVDLILVGGHFSSQDAQLTADVLFYLLLSLFAQSLIPLISRAFYAHHDSKTPLLTGGLGALISIGSSYYFALNQGWGISGIAAGYSLGMMVNALILLMLMHWKIQQPIFDFRRILLLLLFSLAMGGAVVLLKTWIGYPADLFAKIITLILYVAAGVVVYFGLGWLYGVEEIPIMTRKLNHRI